MRWFERFTNLYPSAKGAQCERELVELEDAELNPIGCLAGKTNIIRAKSYEEVGGQSAVALSRASHQLRANCCRPSKSGTC